MTAFFREKMFVVPEMSHDRLASLHHHSFTHLSVTSLCGVTSRNPVWRYQLISHRAAVICRLHWCDSLITSAAAPEALEFVINAPPGTKRYLSPELLETDVMRFKANQIKLRHAHIGFSN